MPDPREDGKFVVHGMLVQRRAVTRSQRRLSDLFTVRVWAEALDERTMEWRGRVQHVPSGETRYFRDWQVLIQFILAMLTRRPETGEPGGDQDTGPRA